VGEDNPNNVPYLWNTPEHTTALSQLLDLAHQKQEQADSALRNERWGKLSPERRAQETWLNMQGDGTPLAVNQAGEVFRGPDAEKKAIQPKKEYTKWMTMEELKKMSPKPEPAKPASYRAPPKGFIDKTFNSLDTAKGVGRWLGNTLSGTFSDRGEKQQQQAARTPLPRSRAR
jgi:hypothetical protein